MKRPVKSIALAASALLLQAAGSAPVPARAPSEIVEAAPASDWVTIAPDDLLVMDLAPDTGGHARRVVIQLMPAPFSQGWIANIRKLAAAHWWDGTSINRVQDNYVVQWGDGTEKKSLPPGLAKVPEGDYTHNLTDPERKALQASVEAIMAFGPVTAPDRLPFDPSVPDGMSVLSKGWPVGTDLRQSWPIHCYGMVGVGRDMPPDAGSGAELYTVIGQAPRHLDRNIALVGRVVSGIENLSSLPRGTGTLGFYEKPEQRVTIKSIRFATELPEATRPHFQYLSTESATFAKYADARANRRDPFFIHPALTRVVWSDTDESKRPYR
ncbi:MAG: peptidylprolyl isomerase [Sphingomonadales bacterium]|nr:peptidylprolyl isomerase [Sphingomonadales bacterium]